MSSLECIRTLLFDKNRDPRSMCRCRTFETRVLSTTVVFLSYVCDVGRTVPNRHWRRRLRRQYTFENRKRPTPYGQPGSRRTERRKTLAQVGKSVESNRRRRSGVWRRTRRTVTTRTRNTIMWLTLAQITQSKMFQLDVDTLQRGIDLRRRGTRFK